jgi:prepilin peptidase CpaA
VPIALRNRQGSIRSFSGFSILSMSLSSALFTVWAALVAWFDCRTRRVTNLLVAVGGMAAFACAVLHAAPFGVTPAVAVLGALVGFIALLPFFGLGVMGAADVKVFAVLGAWCGARALLDVWVAASLASALHALWLLAYERMRPSTNSAWLPWRNGQPTFALGTRRATPYAALLVAAASLELLARAWHGAVH